MRTRPEPIPLLADDTGTLDDRWIDLHRSIHRIAADWQTARARLLDLLTFDEQHPRDPETGQFVDAHLDLLAVVNAVAAHVERASVPAPLPPEADQ